MCTHGNFGDHCHDGNYWGVWPDAATRKGVWPDIWNARCVIKRYCVLLCMTTYTRAPAWFHSRRRRRRTGCLEARAGHRSWPSMWRGASTDSTRRCLGSNRFSPGGWVKTKSSRLNRWNGLPGNGQHCNAGALVGSMPFLQCSIDADVSLFLNIRANLQLNFWKYLLLAETACYCTFLLPGGVGARLQCPLADWQQHGVDV